MLELINSSYSLQVLALIGSKLVYTTIFLYLLFFSIFDSSLFPVHSFASHIPLASFEIMQLVAVLHCCQSVFAGEYYLKTLHQETLCSRNLGYLEDLGFLDRFGILRAILLRVLLF